MGLGDIISDFFGSKNKGNKDSYAMQAPTVDPNAYQYAGRQGGADEAAQYYRTLGAEGQGRQGEHIDTGQSDWDRIQSQYARQGQNATAAMMLARASGATPSIAQMQADRQMGQVQAAQAAQAASARGPAAMALAQQNAANNIANAQGDISNQAQINAANERMQAEQNAFGAYTGMRGSDLQSQGQSAQQAQAQAQINAAQRAQNDQYQQGMIQNEMGVRNSQLTAGMNQQAQQSSNQLGAGQINAGISGQNASMNQQNALGVVGTIANVGGSFATGGAIPPPKAKGGPVAGREPYLVGEQGPELIIPKHDGTVIPAGPTAAILALMGQPRAMGGPVHAGGACYPARAAGGPVQAGGQPMAWAPSTWGYGTTPNYDAQAQGHGAYDALSRAQQPNDRPTQGGLAVAGFPGAGPASKDDPLRRRDQETIALANARKAQGVETTGRDDYEAEGAQYREEQAKANERKKPARPEAEEAKKPTLGSLLKDTGGSLQKQAGAVDTAYHGGGGGLAVPHLLALPARAMGGPVQAGGQPGMVDIGGGGASRSDVLTAAAGSRDAMNTVGGGGLVGGTNVPTGISGVAGGALSKLGSNLQKMAGDVDTGYHGFPARAGGGPVDAGGEPSVLPLYEPAGKQLHQSEDGHAFYADAPKEDARPLMASRPASPAEVAISLAGPQRQAQRQMTPDELMAWANRLQGQMGAEHAAYMARGARVKP